MLSESSEARAQDVESQSSHCGFLLCQLAGASDVCVFPHQAEEIDVG